MCKRCLIVSVKTDAVFLPFFIIVNGANVACRLCQCTASAPLGTGMYTKHPWICVFVSIQRFTVSPAVSSLQECGTINVHASSEVLCVPSCTFLLQWWTVSPYTKAFMVCDVKLTEAAR